jgi:hypothetical protein
MNSNVDHDGNGGRTGWNGNYYVTIRLATGAIVRRNAARRLPKGGCTILATDNGMQGRDYYRKMLADLRAKAKGVAHA